MEPSTCPFADPPVVMGHRGAPLREPENTLPAFARAAGEGATWVELDARLTADGAVVVNHDPVTADGALLIERTAGELGERGIPELGSLLDALPPGLGVDVELKNIPGDPDYDEDDRLAEVVAGLLEQRVGTRPLMVSSFNPLTVQRLVDQLPACPAGLLFVDTLTMDAAAEVAGEVGARILCPHVDVPDLGTVAVGEAHEQGFSVLVWTVDDPGAARRLAEAGVDAICTNDPAGIVSALASR